MIKNLDLNTLTAQIGSNSGFAGTDQLMGMLAKGDNLGLSPEQIQELLQANGATSQETEIADFSKLLEKSLNTEGKELNLESKVLQQQTDILTSNPDALASLENTPVKQGVNLELTALKQLVQNNEMNHKQLVDLLEKKPELKQVVARLLDLNKVNTAENKKLQAVTSQILDLAELKQEPVTLKNLKPVAEKTVSLSKELGLEADAELKSPELLKANQKKNLLKQMQKMTNEKNSLFAKANITNDIQTSEQQLTKRVTESAPAKAMTIQDILVGNSLEAELPTEVSAKPNTSTISAPKASAPILNIEKAPVLEANTEQIIDQIKNYIIQSKVSNEQSVQMKFAHQDLGLMNLSVSKAQGDAISVAINASTAEAVKFFAENQRELIQVLNSSGLQVADFKLETQNSSSKDFNFDEQNLAGKDKNQSQSKQNENQKDSQRRKELWEQFEKEIA